MSKLRGSGNDIAGTGMGKNLTLHIRINGRPHMLAATQDDKLSSILRRVSAKGFHEGCGEGRCGACAVLLDGMVIRSCRFYAWQVEGRAIDTMTLDRVFPRPHPLRQALDAEPADAVAAISPGMVQVVKDYLDANPASTSVHMGMLLGPDAARQPGYDTIVSALMRVFTSRAQRPS